VSSNPCYTLQPGEDRLDELGVLGREGLNAWMGWIPDRADVAVEAAEGIEESFAKSLGWACRVLVKDEDGVFVAVAAESIPVGFELG